MEIKSIANALADKGLALYTNEYFAEGRRMAYELAEEIKQEILRRGEHTVEFYDRIDGVYIVIDGKEPGIDINAFNRYDIVIGEENPETFAPGCDTIEDVVDATLEAIE